MGIEKLVLNAGKCLLNRAGIMTGRQMLAATTKVGRGITEAASKGNLSAELAGSIIKKALPKGVKAPDFITLSLKEADYWTLQTGLIDDISVFKETIRMAGGMNAVNPKNANSILYLNPALLNGNCVAHEFRHHLDQLATLKGKLTSLLNKFLAKSKKQQLISKRLSPIVQKKYNELEVMIACKAGILNPTDTRKLLYPPTKIGLLWHLGVFEKDFDTFLHVQVNNLLTDVSRKDSIKILKYLVKQAQSEKNAYFSGAKITRALGHIKKGESTYSDMSAVFHDELVKVLKQILKKERKAYYKSFLGFKTPKTKIVPAELKTKTETSLNLGDFLSKASAKRVNAATSGAPCKSITTLEEELKKQQATIKKFGEAFLDDGGDATTKPMEKIIEEVEIAMKEANAS
ncbi:MAG: hypothetical protein MJ180_01990 [Candidatus Gastranaerophilales bacterium]|nr:hypothetical protein [Candidatus Gastranaerophilales bacterium]